MSRRPRAIDMGIVDVPGMGSVPVPPVKRFTEDAVVDLPLTAIRPNERQPRRVFDEKALALLAASIRETGGVLQPILVRPVEDGKYELVVGERRWRASAVAGMSCVRAIVESRTDASSARAALVENIAREDLNPVEEAWGYVALHETFGMDKQAIANLVGKDRSLVSHLIKMLDLPDRALDLIRAGRLTEGHGRQLLRVDGADAQASLAEQCAAAGWSVRALEAHIKALGTRRQRVRAPSSADEDAMIEQTTERYVSLFGTRPTAIVPRKGAYYLEVRFEGLAEAAEAVRHLRYDGPGD